MAREAVVVTGSLGGIGRAISARLRAGGLLVIGIDWEEGGPQQDYEHVRMDLASLAQSTGAAIEVGTAIESARRRAGADQIVGLVNNAAIQVVQAAALLDAAELRRSLDVNVVAPLVLAQCLRGQLTRYQGCIVNIGSIHARLTKPGFCAYSTSKSALSGLSRALAVEWGGDIRVATIEPAAVATPMLEAGFSGRPEARAALELAHPSRSIGSVEHVAEWVYRIVVDRQAFTNGMLLRLDGGIGGRLHDPADD